MVDQPLINYYWALYLGKISKLINPALILSFGALNKNTLPPCRLRATIFSSQTDAASDLIQQMAFYSVAAR